MKMTKQCKSYLALNNWDTTFIVHFPQHTVLTKMAVICIFRKAVLASQLKKKKKVKIKGITMSMYYFNEQNRCVNQVETDITYPATVSKCIYKRSNKSKSVWFLFSYLFSRDVSLLQEIVLFPFISILATQSFSPSTNTIFATPHDALIS